MIDDRMWAWKKVTEKIFFLFRRDSPTAYGAVTICGDGSYQANVFGQRVENFMSLKAAQDYVMREIMENDLADATPF